MDRRRFITAAAAMAESITIGRSSATDLSALLIVRETLHGYWTIDLLLPVRVVTVARFAEVHDAHPADLGGACGCGASTP